MNEELEREIMLAKEAIDLELEHEIMLAKEAIDLCNRSGRGGLCKRLLENVVSAAEKILLNEDK